MIAFILLLLIIFWLLGYIQIPGFILPNPTIFIFNNQLITLFNIFIFLLIVWLIGLLPSPFWEIAMLMLILWILSTIGLIVVSGLSNILIIAVIFSLIFYLLSDKSDG